MLTGDNFQHKYPFLAINVAIEGNHIVAAARYEIVCSAKNPGRFGSDLRMTGEIAPDGSFTLSPPGDQTTVVIKGAVPASGETMWKGTYSFTIPRYKPLSSNPYGVCTTPQEGSFVARGFAPLSGTYSGELKGDGFLQPAGNPMKLTFQISQGAPKPGFGEPAHVSVPPFPLSGTVSVTGSNCFAEGVTRDPVEGNQIYGNRFDLNFAMDSGSVLMVDGWVAGADSTTLQDVKVTVGLFGTKCFGATGTATLTKR